MDEVNHAVETSTFYADASKCARPNIQCKCFCIDAVNQASILASPLVEIHLSNGKVIRKPQGFSVNLNDSVYINIIKLNAQGDSITLTYGDGQIFQTPPESAVTIVGPLADDSYSFAVGDKELGSGPAYVATSSIAVEGKKGFLFQVQGGAAGSLIGVFSGVATANLPVYDINNNAWRQPGFALKAGLPYWANVDGMDFLAVTGSDHWVWKLTNEIPVQIAGLEREYLTASLYQSATSGVLVAAVSGKKIKVVAITFVNYSGTPSVATLETSTGPVQIFPALVCQGNSTNTEAPPKASPQGFLCETLIGDSLNISFAALSGVSDTQVTYYVE